MVYPPDFYDPNDYYDGDFTYEKGRDEIRDSCREWIEGIIEQLYGCKEFNEKDFEWYLEELCHRLKVKFPKDRHLRKVI